jgi:hypothetical protein
MTLYKCRTERRGRVVNTSLRIREAPGSSLGSESGYPDEGFSWFSSVTPGEFKDSTLVLGHDRFLPNPFQLIIRLSLFHLTPYSLSY